MIWSRMPPNAIARTESLAVERKWQVCRPGADLHNATARFPQGRKECVHHGQRAENVHFEFASDGVEWERLDRSGSQDSGVTDEKIEVAIYLPAHGTSPALDSWRTGDISSRRVRYTANLIHTHSRRRAS
jgi:hypothetical protein